MAVDYALAEVEWVTGTKTILEIVKEKLSIVGTGLGVVRPRKCACFHQPVYFYIAEVLHPRVKFPQSGQALFLN